MNPFCSFKFVIVFVVSVGILCMSHNGSGQEISFTEQWDTARVLENPHKGWYHHLFDNGISKYAIEDDSIFASFPGMDHLYLRLCWSYLEPEEGKFNWHFIDDIVKKYVPLGYKISFRITCSETASYPGSVGEEVDGVQYATPSWVRNAGTKGTVVETRGFNNTTWVPDWDDPVFLEKLDQFHEAFALRYDGQPWVSYVDIGSIGDWGEGHTSFTTEIPPTFAEVKAHMNIYLKNYKKSLIVACDGYFTVGKTKREEQKLYQYAVSKGISLRDDSPLVDYYIEKFPDSWSVSHPYLYDPLYIQRPIIFELQHYRIVKRDGNWLGKNGAEKIPEYGYSGATIMRKAIETMHATYIGYHGYAEKWLADNPELTKELLNLCGYWYFPVRAAYPFFLKKGENNEFSIVWFNKGVAPAYNTFDLVLRFESSNSKDSFELTINSGNKYWLPGISKTEKYSIEIPLTSKKGNYIMKFKLAERTGERIVPIQIGLKESVLDNMGFVDLGKVQIN